MRPRHENREAIAILTLGAQLIVLAASASVQPVSATPPDLPDVHAACSSTNPYLITACFADVADAGPDPAAVIAFRDTDDDGPHPILATEKQVGALWGLAYSGRHSSIYAAAFHKRQMRFGPGGPGAVYRIDLVGGDVSTFVTVPDAGEDRHEPSAMRGPDRRARDWAGKTSLADIEFDQQANMVIGLNDRAFDAGLTTRDFHDPVNDWLIAPPDTEWPVVGGGDTLRGERSGDRWDVQPVPEFYFDDGGHLDEANLGGLAALTQPDEVVSAAMQFAEGWRGLPWFVDRGAYWLANPNGVRTRGERLCSARITSSQCEGYVLPSGDLGDVELLCSVSSTPTPVPSVTPTPTASAPPSPSTTVIFPPTAMSTTTPTPVPDPTATATPPASPTQMRTPHTACLPLVLRERCIPGEQNLDVALVIDASTTMRDGRTSTGRARLAAAIEAAQSFVDMLALPQDQAAVVTFNSDALLLQELTDRRADIDSALGRITVERETRLDRGVAVAHDELTSERRRAGNAAVMIVLTDGLANPVPASVAVDEANAAKDDGITVFTIGLGSELDVAELKEMATRPEYFYEAPDGEDLLTIYRTIAVGIPCPTRPYWGRR